VKLIKATDADNERLLHFFSQSRIDGSIELRFRRMFSFFNHYRLQTDDYVTYMLLNKKDEVEAMASLLFRPAVVNGEKEVVAYATDLRVSKSRRAIMEWSNHFLPILEKERAERNCRLTFSVLAHSQRQAYNALVRPRNLRRNLPRYYQFRKFELVTLHGLWPFHRKPLPGIRVRTATDNDLPRIAEYVVEKSAPRPLHYAASAGDVLKQIERWRDLNAENFFLAEDVRGELIGCVASWNASQIQRVYAHSYSAQVENLRDMLSVLRFVSPAHRLPAVGGELQMRHLSFLNANNPDIFYSLLYNAFLHAAPGEVLFYPHFQDHLLSKPPKSFISIRKQYGLYCILSPGDPVPSFLRPSTLAEPPLLETAWL
jgi:hypothetical protein